jgi:hypothetical protein
MRPAPFRQTGSVRKAGGAANNASNANEAGITDLGKPGSGAVLVERKAVKALDPIRLAQCLNYVTATDLPVCLYRTSAIHAWKSDASVRPFEAPDLFAFICG